MNIFVSEVVIISTWKRNPQNNMLRPLFQLFVLKYFCINFGCCNEIFQKYSARFGIEFVWFEIEKETLFMTLQLMMTTANRPLPTAHYQLTNNNKLPTTLLLTRWLLTANHQ